MADWITTVNGLIALITGLCGLVGTGIATFLAVKNWIKATKEKSSKEIWAMIMSAADAAMNEVEHSIADGKTKKETVMNTVKETCKAAGIDVSPFIDQLDAYIEQCIKWFNDMNKK